MLTPQELFDSDLNCARLAGMTEEAAAKHAQSLALRRTKGELAYSRREIAEAWDQGYAAGVADASQEVSKPNPYRDTPDQSTLGTPEIT